MTDRITTQYLIEKEYLDTTTLDSEETRDIDRFFSDIPKKPKSIEAEEFTARVGEVIEGAEAINVRPLAYGGMGMIYLAYQFPPRFVADNKEGTNREELDKEYKESKGEFLKNHGFKFTDPMLATKYMREGMQGLLKRFLREGQLTGEIIKNPWIPRAVFHNESVIAQKFFYGAESLYEIILKGEMGIPKRWKIGTNTTGVISDIHEQTRGLSPAGIPVLHRDIKPENILADEEGNAIVLDFGISGPWGLTRYPSEDEVTEEDTRLTIDDSFMGTVAYASPEVAEGGIIATREPSEVYSLGGTLYHLLTGRRPYSGKNPRRILIDIMMNNNPPPKAHEINPDITPDMSNIIEKSMERDPKNRFQTVLEMKEAMREAKAPKLETQVDSKSRFSLPTQIDRGTTMPSPEPQDSAETDSTDYLLGPPRDSQMPTISDERKTISEEELTISPETEKETPTMPYVPKDEESEKENSTEDEDNEQTTNQD